MTDVEAGRADRASDLRRFETLILDHADAVLAYAARRSDPDTAQEILADTFVADEVCALDRRESVGSVQNDWSVVLEQNALPGGRAPEANPAPPALLPSLARLPCPQDPAPR